ncbi:MAG: glycosyltransferase family 4 protein [Bacteroidaceae bacterium]|nr:glycosyltransferase family 4 protein [Bacteroidaceae bacterium]
MKILQIASGDFFSTYGGGQVYVKNIVDEMIRQGLDVAVLSFINKDIAIVEHAYKGIPLWEIGTQAKDSDIEELLRTISPSIIHAHSKKVLFATLGERLHIPVIVTVHHGGILCPAGTLMNADDCICQTTVSHEHCLRCSLANIRTGRSWYPMMRIIPKNGYLRLGRALQKLPFIPFLTPIGSTALSIQNKIAEWQTICDKATAIIAPSHAIADAMCRNGLSRDKVTVIAHGIPKNEEIQNDCPSKFGGRAHAEGVSILAHNGKIRFFYVGRICRIKGIHVLLEAFSGLADVDKAELHIIGGAGNKGEQRYMGQLQRKYTSSNIVWHGKVAPDKVFATIKDFDVMVHPTICLEVFGLNIAESLAMNKPVLATRCGGAEMQIEDGVNGWLVNPNDVEALRYKMNEIVVHGIDMDVYSFHKSVNAIDNHVKDLIKVYEKETFVI